MDKAEWDAMEQRARDALIAEKVMHLEVYNKSGKVLWGRPKIGSAHQEMNPREHDEDFGPKEIKEFTTDRNACALVLDKADLPILLAHLLAVTGETDVDISGRAGTKAMCNLLRADPDTICYCALKAVEDARQ